MADIHGVCETLLFTIIVSSVLIAFYAYSATQGDVSFGFTTCMIFFFTGPNFALYMPLTVILFGQKFATENYGFVFVGYCVGTVLFILLQSNLDLNFNDNCLSVSLLNFLGFVNLIIFNYFMLKESKEKEILNKENGLSNENNNYIISDFSRNSFF
jgi:hypothetical protein